MIKVTNLSKTFDGFKALDDASITVEKGSIYGLVGPNGAGKTTLIKHLAGVYTPDGGEYTLDGNAIYENPGVKSKIIYIGDDLHFFPSYTIMDAAKLYKDIYPTWSDERFESLKEIFKIDTKRKIRRLSKGMQKQVAFWLGVSTCPEVLILDEPVDGLDPVMRRNVWKVVMQDVAEYGTTVLISSHNLRELEDVCDHVGIMHQGKVVLEKSLDDIKGNIHKLQLAFEGEYPEDIDKSINILHKETTGRVHMLITKGNCKEIEEEINKFSPIICDIIPLTLEEVFIYELGGMGYEFENILI